jgi:predicted DNA-binding WGR domain protein
MSDSAQLVFKEGNSNKFWHISLTGSETTVVYGRVGTSGQTQKKNHGTAAKARTFFDKMVAEKTKKGYAPSKAANAAAPKRKADAATPAPKRGRGAAAKKKDDDDDDDDEEEDEEPVKKPARGRGRKPEPEPVEDDEDEDEDEEDDDDDDDDDSSIAPDDAVVPVRFIMDLGSGADQAFGLFADDKNVVAGDENGVVIECTHTATEIKLQRKFQLPSGVKAIVRDGQFLYAGTVDGELFDLTQSAPRSMCKIENFNDIFWIDVYDGCIAASSGSGDLAFINGEGEVVWRVNADTWPNTEESCDGGWMCRADATGIYHGHGAGVAKYDFKGKRLWHTDEVQGVLFGVQTATHVYAVGVDASCNSLTAKLNKKNGKVETRIRASGPSCAVDASGKTIVVCGRAFDDKGDKLWNFNGPDHSELLFGMSAALVGTRLFTIVDEDTLNMFDVSAASTKKALGGNGGATKKASAGSAKAVTASTSVEKTTDRSKGVEVECVKEGSKLRIRVVSKGYNSDWNVQFPRALREPGAHFMCDSIVESTTGGFYRAVGDIRRLG